MSNVITKLSPCSYFRNKMYENVIIKKKRRKVKNENFVIPTYDQYEILVEKNLNVSQLKKICKYYKQKKTGNKNILVHRLYNYLKLSKYALVLQKVYKGYLCRKIIQMRGPGLKKKSLCINKLDFVYFEPISKIKNEQFYSYKDTDNFIYGFDICSLYNMIVIDKRDNKITKNPFNRQEMPKDIIAKIIDLIRLSKIMKINLNLDLNDDNKKLTSKQKLNLKIYSLFQKIDNLGNITNAAWLLNLNKIQLIRFIKELYDIWFHRATLTPVTMKNISPPIGNPFHNLNINTLYLLNYKNIINKIIIIINNFIDKGVDKDSKVLGCYYVLAALTLVSKSAAEALPWLYPAVSHN